MADISFSLHLVWIHHMELLLFIQLGSDKIYRLFIFIDPSVMICGNNIAIRNHIITTPGLGKENKEQYINKLETKLGKEIEDGRREGYGDIKNIIFPPAKGLSIESLIQTPQQTYAIMAAQMALDSWINTEVKANRSPLKNEIRRKAQQLAQDYQVKFKDKIQYLEKEMEQLNLK